MRWYSLNGDLLFRLDQLVYRCTSHNFVNVAITINVILNSSNAGGAVLAF